MAAFPAREKETFIAHWKNILRDDSIIKKTVLFDRQVAGNVVSFEHEGKREVGYWIGKQFWGKGIATRALSQFLSHVKVRPLYAHVAKHNIASTRVLQKCGFTIYGEDKEFSTIDGEIVEGLILMLDGGEKSSARG
jgi:RimJ/RimL family protein N-acetyltransferase